MAEVEGMHLRSSGRENNNKCLVAGGRRKRGEAKMAARILVWGAGWAAPSPRQGVQPKNRIEEDNTFWLC